MTIHTLPTKPSGDAPSGEGAPAAEGQVISLSSAKPRQEYVEALEAIAADLGATIERLTGLGIGAVLEGPLHEWSEAQPVGKVMSFGTEDFVASGRPELVALAATLAEAHQCLEIIEERIEAAKPEPSDEPGD